LIPSKILWKEANQQTPDSWESIMHITFKDDFLFQRSDLPGSDYPQMQFMNKFSAAFCTN